MLTTLFALKIVGVVLTTEQLVSAGFAAFFLASEWIGNNPRIKANSLFQLVLSLIKRSRTEDDTIDDIQRVLRERGVLNRKTPDGI
jgi:hypothetical protein